MDTKENRRVKMTKRLLNDSFISFLEKKPLSRITVKEICEEADINRSTYYTYYTDPYDQLKQLKAGLIRELSNHIHSLINEPRDHDHKYWLIKGFLDYIQSQKRIFQVLLGKGGDLDFERELLTFFSQDYIWDRTSEDIEDRERSFKFLFASMGSFGIISYWLLRNPEMDTEVLAEMITRYTEPFRK